MAQPGDAKSILGEPRSVPGDPRSVSEGPKSIHNQWRCPVLVPSCQGSPSCHGGKSPNEGAHPSPCPRAWVGGSRGTHTRQDWGAGSGVPYPQKGPKGGPGSGDSGREVWWEPVTAGEHQGGGQESTRGPYRGFGGRGRGLGVTFKDDLPPGSLQRLHSLIVGGIAEIDAVNSEDGVA